MAEPRKRRLTAGRVVSHLGVMIAVAAVLGVVVAGLAVPFAGVLGLGARNVAQSMDTLPQELETEKLAQRTRIVDGEGNVIATLFDENRVNVPLSQISRRMVKAIVAIEDYRFYEHGALDMKGTLRALITNQASSAVVQGGSSITQQMVKLTLISQADTKAERLAASDDTYARKLRELRYAVAVEQRQSKDWILERYLNLAYYGDGAYGVQAAARHYFNVDARDLDLAQSAMLAGLVKNPTGYDPTNAPDRAIERRNVVLDRMAELNVVKPKVAKRTKKRDLDLNVRNTQNGCVYSRAPFFCDYTLSYLLRDRALGETQEERRELIYSGGLTIHTTVDLRAQAAADTSVRSHVFQRDGAIGALAMVEPRTGEVQAVAQSRPMGRDKEAGETYLNYVIPQEYGDSAGFQAGSTFKPFVLASAVEQGIPLSQTFVSPEKKRFDQADFANCSGEPPFVGKFAVENSTSSGIMDLYSGTQLSVNTFYLQLERETGVCAPYELAQQMGIRLTNPVGPGAERVPIFTLGVANVSPLEMAEAYATFAGRGLHCASRPVTAIEDSGGNVVRNYPARCDQVMESATADAVNDVLRGVLEGDGFGAALALDQPSAGKTGTTQDGKSVWFVGYTPQLSTAAMIAGANDFGQPIPLKGQTIGGDYIYTASGSGFAGPVWGDAMGILDDGLEDKDFVEPSSTDIFNLSINIPETGGLSVAEAQSLLEYYGFVVELGGYRDSDFPVDTVAYTSPIEGAELDSGGTVTIYQSDGTPYVFPSPPEETDDDDGGRSNGRGNGQGGGRGNG